MKKFKRLTALALALVMVLGLTTGAGAAGAKYSSWFAPYYKEMQELGILPSSFTSGDLTATITRGEMCELAVYAFEKATGNDIDLAVNLSTDDSFPAGLTASCGKMASGAADPDMENIITAMGDTWWKALVLPWNQKDGRVLLEEWLVRAKIFFC